jgi:hypothetical protein
MLAMKWVFSTHLADVGHDEGLLWQSESSNVNLAESLVDETGRGNISKPAQT